MLELLRYEYDQSSNSLILHAMLSSVCEIDLVVVLETIAQTQWYCNYAVIFMTVMDITLLWDST